MATIVREKLPGSFRDPSGFLFTRDGTLFRQIDKGYREDYDRLIGSGLFGKLVGEQLIIPHEEIPLDHAFTDDAYKIIKPEVVPFVSYPYEWSFSQLKDAALTTLRIQKISLDFGMSLKDASAYNIQFMKGNPVLIDTLSFERLKPGEPWIAYRQFCQHFLAPLALMSFRDVRLNKLLSVHIDGIPLELASSLLPARTKLKGGLLLHIHLHGKAQKHYADKAVDKKNVVRKVSLQSLRGFIESLESTVEKLNWEPHGTEWADYYDSNNNYATEALRHKEELVLSFIKRAKPKNVWDLGANTGFFSRAASRQGIPTVAFDIDPVAVEKHYLDCRASNDQLILPLVLDLKNPSPALGWAGEERMSFLERGPADMALALALIHHLAISNNVPLPRIAEFFGKSCRWLAIEFVPKEDSQVRKLLATREDVFPNYSQKGFEEAFRAHFKVLEQRHIKNSDRTLYLMER